ncbi:hypothetical protein JHC27_06365 [archaeon]|nr:hypothetical protein [archaeon]
MHDNFFNFYVSVYEETTLPFLSGTKIRDFFLDPKSCAYAYREGRKKIREIFGPEISLPCVSPAHFSYGHLACLGADIDFPENGEPVPKVLYKSIEEAIESLKRGVNFRENKLFKHYYMIYEYLKGEFGEEARFEGFGWEGPLTSAILLRGSGFFLDLKKNPNRVREYLELLTESIVEFVYFIREINGEPRVNPTSTGLCDDMASYLNPILWEEFVLPYWEIYYSSLTSGKRSLHCENLTPEHLDCLKKAKVSHFDPSISSKTRRLTASIVREKLGEIPFSWRLPSFELVGMSSEDVKKWVINAFKDGASEVYLVVEPILCDEKNSRKVLEFMKVAKKIKTSKLVF